MAGFEYLSEVTGRKDHRVLLLSGVLGDVSHLNQVGSERQLWSVFFDNTEGKQAGGVSLLDAC